MSTCLQTVRTWRRWPGGEWRLSPPAEKTEPTQHIVGASPAEAWLKQSCQQAPPESNMRTGVVCCPWEELPNPFSVMHSLNLRKSFDCILSFFFSTCFLSSSCLQIFPVLGTSHCFLFYLCVAHVFCIECKFKEHTASERKYPRIVSFLIYILISSTTHWVNGFYEASLSGKCKGRHSIHKFKEVRHSANPIILVKCPWWKLYIQGQMGRSCLTLVWIIMSWGCARGTPLIPNHSAYSSESLG